jgi:hypothetical protein
LRRRLGFHRELIRDHKRQLIREQLGTSTPLYHRRHYNSRGQLFDVRLGTDGKAINDSLNPAQ